ncbi:hypothetical protein V8J36_02505 [Frigidibacter sp. MR17.14]|uniref:hypothetical protein n=1 Tax=Frigidibacter sp. MR17.14 TaxID=3126509 RepID=UPI003012E451
MVRALLLLALLAGAAAAEEPRVLTIEPHPLHGRIVEGEMIPVTIRGVYDRPVAREEMVIAPSDRFDWVQLGKDDWHRERVDGVERVVVERHLAIFPNHTGIARFGPVKHELQIIDQATSRRVPVTVIARPVELTIAPMPDDPPFHSPHGWRFTAAGLTLTDELSTDPATLKDGETVTRTVTLRAEGALPEMLPPRPVIQQNWLITFTAPVERRLELTPEGPVATVVWRWQFRPHTGEPGVLPAEAIPFFNTTTRRVEKVEIPALPIGYGSFRSSQVPSGEIGTASLAALVCTTLGGMLLGLAILMRGERVARSRLAENWARISPVYGWRMARAQGPLALRRAAEDWARARQIPPARAAAALAPLDRAIYARAAPMPEAKTLRRALRAARRG